MKTAAPLPWRLARIATLAVFLILIPLLALDDGHLAPLVWRGVVPLLPLVFLVHPGIWRNICPLATLGTGRVEGLPDRGAPLVLPGVIALMLLLPLRPVLLESSGLISAGLLVAIGGFALFVGGRSHGKAGFCNRLCPILPVERLYGQAPLVQVGNARCGNCDLCAPRGCLDLNPGTAVAQVLGESRHGAGWTLAPFGAFAAAFPGMILGFYTLPASPSIPLAYGGVLGGGLMTWAVVAILARLVRLEWRVGLVLLGGTAAALHLWFALPGVLSTWGVDVPALPMHLIGSAFALGWTGLALKGPRKRLVQLG